MEDLLANFPTTCVLRVRMPISDDLSHRNFITKIVKYDRVVNVPNSMTCLTEMLPVSVIMAERKLTGVYFNEEKLSHFKLVLLLLIVLAATTPSLNKLSLEYVITNYVTSDHSLFSCCFTISVFI